MDENDDSSLAEETMLELLPGVLPHITLIKIRAV